MPHQCTHCSRIIPDASVELLQGCVCGSRFFYYIKQEKLDELKHEVKQIMTELDKADKVQIEKDIRELTGLDEEPDKPIILDIEAVKVLRPGKFEIDIVKLFKQRPLIYKLGEGKYVIDIASSMKEGGNMNYFETDDSSDEDSDEANEEFNEKVSEDLSEDTRENV